MSDARKKEGYRLMDSLFQANEASTLRAFMPLVIDKISANILREPDNERFRRLNLHGKAYSTIQGTKGGAKLLHWLGFRKRVVEMRESLVLAREHVEQFGQGASLVRSQWEKHVRAQQADRDKKEKTEADKVQYKEAVLARIEEDARRRQELIDIRVKSGK